MRGTDSRTKSSLDKFVATVVAVVVVVVFVVLGDLRSVTAFFVKTAFDITPGAKGQPGHFPRSLDAYSFYSFVFHTFFCHCYGTRVSFFFYGRDGFMRVQNLTRIKVKTGTFPAKRGGVVACRCQVVSCSVVSPLALLLKFHGGF